MSTVKKKPAFYEVGKETGKIDVRVSYYIIKHFSDGLYSSPNKAVEELVSNAWDAGAENVHVILPADRDSVGARIVVIDDGCGMDEGGLRQHWLLGDSKKRLPTVITPKGRKQIGKFGIGKLATYVLAHRLTHITKAGGKYYSTSMDYHRIDENAGDATTEKLIKLDLLELSAKEAFRAVSEWTEGKDVVHKALRLFGKGAPASWTVAVMSDLKPLAKELSQGKLRWVLETAMPLGEDFRLFLNGERVASSKEKSKKIGTWILGRDIGTTKEPLPKPAPDDIEESEDKKEVKDSPKRYGVFHPLLQRVTGFIEAYEDELGGKSENWGQSSGFFVYVRGRRINVEDPGFGVDRNKLQHGTFARFRIVVHMDGLDNDLRSSREGVREGDRLTVAREILIAGFNHARSKLKKHFDESKPGAAMAARVADSPASLTARPIFSILADALDGRATPRYFEIPKNLPKNKRAELLATFEHPDKEGFRLVENAELSVLAPQDGIARYDVVTRVLRINTMHPFVAHFLNEFQSNTQSLPLELFAVSEVLLEAHLYQTAGDEESVQEVLERRDQLLRHLAKTTGRKNAFLIAQDLEEAAHDKSALERELVNAFASLGFDAVPLGGPNKADGIAVAHLSGRGDSQRTYSVSLESKSKEVQDRKVSAKMVDTAAVTRHRDDENYQCQHALVVGPDFPASDDGSTALEKQIRDAKGQPERTITLIRVKDLARLVRIQPQKRIGLEKIRELFVGCQMPEHCAEWITTLEKMTVEEPPYRQILDVIWKIQQDEPESQVEYGKLKTALRYEKQIDKKPDELRNICRSMMGMAGASYITASARTVELGQRPEKVLETIRAIADRENNQPKKKS